MKTWTNENHTTSILGKIIGLFSTREEEFHKLWLVRIKRVRPGAKMHKRDECSLN
jgi:hypothetical protein